MLPFISLNFFISELFTSCLDDYSGENCLNLNYLPFIWGDCDAISLVYLRLQPTIGIYGINNTK